MDTVAAHSEADATRIRFFGATGSNDVKIGGSGRDGDKDHCFGPGWHIRAVAATEASNVV